MNYFIGYYGDQVFLLWSVWWYKTYKVLGFTTENFSPLYAAPFGKSFGGISTEPITWGLFYFLSKYVDGLFVYNFLIILGFLLSLLFSYLLFKGYFHKFIAIYLAISYSFSSYYSSSSISKYLTSCSTAISKPNAGCHALNELFINSGRALASHSFTCSNCFFLRCSYCPKCCLVSWV